MRLYRTNNEFNLRVLMYHGFTVLSMLFFHKIGVCLEPSCSIFNMILSLFLQENCSKPKCRRQLIFSAEVTHKGHWLKVQAPRETQEIWPSDGLRKDRRFVDWSTYNPVESSIVLEIVPLLEIEESLSMEQRQTSTDCRRIDWLWCWSVDWLREDASWRWKKKMLSLDWWRQSVGVVD